LLIVLAVDLMGYWLHRACHTFTPLWRLHEVPHSPDMLYTSNTARFHQLEKVLHFSLDSVPFLLLGVAPEMIAAYFLLCSANVFLQCNARLRYGWLNYVVASAETHRWHHAWNPKTAHCNFSNTIIVWELLFGAWYLPKKTKCALWGSRIVATPGHSGHKCCPLSRTRVRAIYRCNAGVGARIKSRLINVAVGVNLMFTDCLNRLRLRSALRDPMRSQRAVLARILRANRETSLGV
jgi:hypothetical protein